VRHTRLVSFKNVSIGLPDRLLVRGLSFSVQSGRLLALVGANGCGKSTILNLVESRHTGRDDLSDDSDVRASGEINLAPGISLVHLPQLLQANRDLVHRNYSLLPELSGRAVRLCDEFQVIEAAEPADRLSDGEIQKRAIIRTLLEDHDLYLLDEPTNYLDIAGITAFENHVAALKDRGKGIILVTHDRTLTDNLADSTLLISEHGIYRTVGGCSRARSVRSTDLASRHRLAKAIKRKIGELQDDCRRRAGWAAQKEKQKIGARGAKAHISRLSKKMAKRAKAIQRRAEREVERLTETRPFVPKKLHLQFPPYDVRNRRVFSLDGVSFRYDGPSGAEATRDESRLLQDISLSATTRDKICLMGANGSGKSTIIRLIQRQLTPLAGRCYLNDGVTTEYVPQGLEGFFKAGTLLDNFAACNCNETAVRQHLGAALIRKDKAREPIDRFSYGELMRAAIVKCILSRAEFLYLDEPTSHLDIESIEVLEELLCGFAGGFLLISHDRSFVGNVADSLHMLRDARLTMV